jgi:predicted ATPase
MMITNLSLKNFKAFEEELFDFGPLNILSGLNNSGKSSVIQSLRLLNEKRPLPDLGPLIEYVRTDTKGFCLQCGQTGKPEDITFSYDRDGKIVQTGVIEGLVSYISADRLGPRNSLPLSIDGSVTTVGSKGENIVDFLSLLDSRRGDDLQVPEALMATKGTGVNGNIKEWLRFISPGVDFMYESDHHTDTGRTEFNKHRPGHVGFGLSYTLPIIASVLIHASQLSVKKINMALLLIENPEAHLHPSGQTKMGELMALAASCGVQIVVETHSDHLLNGVRIAVKEKQIRSEDVKCFFFKSEDNERPATVNRISIDKHGMMDYWPEGFLDETEKNLMRLV